MSVYTNQYNASIVFTDGTEFGSNTGGAIPLGINNAFADALSLTQATSQTITGPLTLSGAITASGTVTYNAAEVKKVTVFTTAGNYTVAATDRYVIINKASGAATGVVLPTSPATGRILTIKDGKGDSATNNITITASQNIDNVSGGTGIVINIAYASVDLVFDGTLWRIV